MAKSTKALLTGRIQKCKTNPSIAHIGLATHGLRACARARKGRLNARRKYFLSTNLVKSDTLSACPDEFWLVKAWMMFALRFGLVRLPPPEAEDIRDHVI